jgi:hypothetical protein
MQNFFSVRGSSVTWMIIILSYAVLIKVSKTGFRTPTPGDTPVQAL